MVLTAAEQPVATAMSTRTAVALFDVDRTLVRGSSLVPFGRALVAEGVIPARTLSRELAREAWFAHRGIGDRGVTSLRTRLLSVAAGHDYDALLATSRRVGRELAARTFAAARWLLDHHLDAGHYCVLLSAGPQELVDVLAAALGADRAVGTRVAVGPDGRLTGELDGPFCYGPAKLERLRADVGDVDLERACAYADSASDIPLLAACGRAVAVNPDSRLAREARRRRWPVVRFG